MRLLRYLIWAKV